MVWVVYFLGTTNQRNHLRFPGWRDVFASFKLHLYAWHFGGLNLHSIIPIFGEIPMGWENPLSWLKYGVYAYIPAVAGQYAPSLAMFLLVDRQASLRNLADLAESFDGDMLQFLLHVLSMIASQCLKVEFQSLRLQSHMGEMVFPPPFLGNPTPSCHIQYHRRLWSGNSIDPFHQGF